MKTKIFVAAILISGSLHCLEAATLYSRNNGNWTAASVWSYTSGGSPCGCTPGAADIVYISHAITLNKHLTNSDGITGIYTINSGASLDGGSSYDMDVKNGGTLTVSGTLNIYDLTFSNGSTVLVNSTATITVNGTFHNKNNSNNVTINGSMNVIGPFINGTGSVMGGTGTVTVTNGPATNTGNLFGCTGTIPAPFPVILPGGCITPLPVALISFDASVHYNKVTLEWATASEVNNKFFTLQKSADAMHFTSVANIPAAGNTTENTRYNYVDNSTDNANVFYRLSQTDFNGRENVLKVIKAQTIFNECIEITSQKNKNVSLRVNCKEESFGLLMISDAMGNLLKEQTIEINNSNTIQNFFPFIPQGMYFVTFIYGSQVVKKKVWIS